MNLQRGLVKGSSSSGSSGVTLSRWAWSHPAPLLRINAARTAPVVDPRPLSPQSGGLAQAPLRNASHSICDRALSPATDAACAETK
jgi:hypothetical protein